MRGNTCLTYLIKDLYVECIKNPDNSIIKPTNQLKMGKKFLKRHFTKEGKQIANQCMQICSASLNSREMQIKNKMKLNTHPLGLLKLKGKTISSIGEALEELELSHTLLARM